MKARKLRERELHNKQRLIVNDHHVSDTRWSPALEKTIKTNPLWSNMKYYAIERKSRKMVFDWYLNNIKDNIVLDYCCGNGEDSIFLAKNGAQQVFGIDISEVSIGNCKRNAEKDSIADQIHFQVMDAENTDFDDNTFDIITEYGALHHLDLEQAFSEMVRILKPNGKAICQEALGHNILIHAYRKMTPHLRTKWEAEHILRKKDIEMAKSYFNRVEILGLFHLATIAAVPFRNLPVFNPILTFLETVDNIFLKLPILKWQAWQVIFVLSEPKKIDR